MIIDWSVQSWINQSNGNIFGPVFFWPVQGAGTPPVIVTTGNQVKTIGVIGEQDDRFMFDTSTGLV